eukprot:1956321-Rhodomonas_salina.3
MEAIYADVCAVCAVHVLDKCCKGYASWEYHAYLSADVYGGNVQWTAAMLRGGMQDRTPCV